MATDSQQQKWIKDGRGQGELSTYRPWITVRDIASRGRSHRVFGHKTRRTHHLLSDLELAVFLMLEWNPLIEDIREQFPLNPEQTTELAKAASIAHPAVGGVLQIMSSDFYVHSSEHHQSRFALQAKYRKDLDDLRVIEKLELERRYWQSKSVPWRIITEAEIPKIVFDNIKWLYPAIRDTDQTDIYEKLSFYVQQFKTFPDLNIINLSKKIDQAYELDLGTSLSELRKLFALRFFKFNILTDYKKLKSSEIQLGNNVLWQEIRHVSN